MKPHAVCRAAALTALVAALLSTGWMTPAGATRAGRSPTGATLASGSAGSGSATEATAATVTLDAISPPVSVPGTVVSLTVTVRNTGATTLTGAVVHVLLSSSGLVTRADVGRWAARADVGSSVREVASRRLAGTLSPGAAVAVLLTIQAEDIRSSASSAVLPLAVDIRAGGSSVGRLHTFLPHHRRKEYERLPIAWVVPLTLGPDPALFGPPSAARNAAWTSAIGPGSRLETLIHGTRNAPVTWAIDPAVFGPRPVAGARGSPPGPTPSPSTTSPTSQGPLGADEVPALAAGLGDLLRASVARHTIWELPYADPDLTGVLAANPADPTLRELLDRPATLTATLGAVATGGAIAWPVRAAITSQRESQLRQALAGQGLTAAVTSVSALSHDAGFTGAAARKSADGLPLLAYDDELSRLFARTSDAGEGAQTVQRFLAETMTLLGERPGTPRTALVAAPRGFAGNPGVLSSLFTAVATAPWLVSTTTEELLRVAVTAAPERPGAIVTTPASPPAAAADPDAASPITAPRLRGIIATKSALEGVASIRDDAADFRTTWQEAQNQLLSTRWRGQAKGWAALDAAARAATTAAGSGIRVEETNVNFFADQGVLQITVINELPVAVHDVRLALSVTGVQANRLLIIQGQPGLLRIGPRSRTTVKQRVHAQGAGEVPITAALSTANGTALGTDATVTVRVQPTATWIFWVLGGLAGIVLVVGVYRSLRRSGPRVVMPGLQESPP